MLNSYSGILIQFRTSPSLSRMSLTKFIFLEIPLQVGRWVDKLEIRLPQAEHATVQVVLYSRLNIQRQGRKCSA